MNIEEAKKKIIILIEENIDEWWATKEDIDALNTLLTAYEKEKEKREMYEESGTRYLSEIGELRTKNSYLQNELEQEKEKNKKAIKYCKEKSTFQTFGDFELQNVLETYINRLKHRILDILEE